MILWAFKDSGNENNIAMWPSYKTVQNNNLRSATKTGIGTS